MTMDFIDVYGAPPQTPDLRVSLRERARRLRKQQTGAEMLLWEHVRGGALGVRFHRQKVIGRYIVDFYCPKAHLVVEVDGSVHSTQMAKRRDAERDEFMQRAGLTVVRVTNRQVRQQMGEIIRRLRILVAGE